MLHSISRVVVSIDYFAFVGFRLLCGMKTEMKYKQTFTSAVTLFIDSGAMR